MNTLFRFLFAALLSFLLGAVWAAPIPDSMESAMGFKSFDLPAEQKGSFEVAFDATPLADNIDVFTGLSAAVPWRASDVAAIVRFNDTGTIDVRHGSVFKADRALPYSANKVYRVRMVIDIGRKTYSVFVAPEGQPEISLAANYSFRDTQSNVQSLGKLVLAGFKGSMGFKGPHRVTGITLKTISSP